MSQNQSLLTPSGPVAVSCVRDPISILKQLLSEHLSQVERYATMVVREGNADTETIHQLRISLRRTETVFFQFGDLIPQQKYRWFEKHLTRLRKVSNPLRDADILLERIEKHHASGPYNGLKEKAHIAQQASFSAVLSACRKWLCPDQAAEHQSSLLQKLDRKSQTDACDRDPIDGERQVLKRIKNSLSTLGREIFARRLSWKGQETLHERRIEIKRLRYALELFEPYLSADRYADVHSRLKSLQSRLGDMNDEAIIVEKLRKWKNDDDICAGEADEIARLKKDISADLDRHLTKFKAWWTISRRTKWKKDWQNFVNTLGEKTYDGMESVLDLGNSSA
ncbi:MAG: CHAD domain-containing protein [Planctomycetaceae bacterium]